MELADTDIGHRARQETNPFPPPGAKSNTQIKVSTLFCDIVDSTRLSIGLTPFELRDLMLDYYALTSAAVVARTGVVVGCRGDGRLAVFGGEFGVVDGGAAINAVTAGLELIDAIQRANSAGFADTPLGRRVAVATGYVVSGQTAAGSGLQGGLFGHAPYLAARLQTVAPENTLVCSADTRALVKSSYPVTFLGWKPLNGSCRDTPVWKVGRNQRQGSESCSREAAE